MIFHMKKWFFLFGLPVFLAGFMKFSLVHQETTASIAERKSNAVGCGPYTEGKIEPGADGKFITVLPGWGRYRYPVSTKNDSAQFYFNQGLNMYYGYHWQEACASFKEAARFDSGCAMAYWGEALALGPGYNFALHYKMRKEVPAVLEEMNREMKGSSSKERQLMEIMNRRYSTDTADRERKLLNIAYAAGLHELMSQFPEDLDIKIFYIDAVMLVHPWDFWNNDGSPKAWTMETVGLCEAVLKENPRHPAALHYYIHLTEASRHPEVALPGADILKDLLPGVAHMVHMASHEYQRNGLFAKGVEVNDLADRNLGNYASLAKSLGLHQHAYHYFAVQAYCALSGGMYRKGMPAAIRCRNSVSPTHELTYDQYLYMMPVLAQVRLGKWAEIIKENNEPDPGWTYSGILNDFAKGMAFVNTGRPDSAVARLTLLQQKAKDPVLSVADTLTNAPASGAAVAGEILSASIFFSQKEYDSAITHIQQAIQIEDGMFYSEPKDWLIPPRQFLGAFYLRLGKTAMAENVYRQDLDHNPGNGWSLLGLCQSLQAQHKKAQVPLYREKYSQSFSAADEIPPGSVYMKSSDGTKKDRSNK
jgi:tetratricopeptide (TPR) repeat protein